MTGEPLQITRLYQINTAPTGEGTRYECSDGSVWRDTQPFKRRDAERVGDRIYPDFNRGGN